ncbi:MAG TPA: Fis family transcriptional regulator, partial [Verrucomicrobiales bacterium]|nr:Fis family transcriptional regulator [Verrucomicrobiales bacterium]
FPYPTLFLSEAPLAYFDEGIDSRFIRVNRAALRILGLKPEEVAGTYGKSFVPDTPDAQRRLRMALDSLGRGTDTNGVVLELRRRDNGKPIWIQWWSRPSPNGEYTRTMFIDITERVLMEHEKARLEAQNTYLREEILAEHNFTEIVGQSPALRRVLDQVDQVAPTDATVLILGETGTGKELIARAIHDRSPRRGRPLVKVNCGAISAGLVESELFGHVKGAFTGAVAARDGRFKLADGGTIFLDEVGELPLDTQVKLLRVLQEQEFEPIGSSRTLNVDVRLIAATNRDLSEAIRKGAFRRDLYYRINVFPVTLPPLREREADIDLLAAFFVEKFAKRFNRPVRRISDDGLRTLRTYDWPGNIRELQNIIERAVVLSRGPVLELPPDFGSATGIKAAAAIDIEAKQELSTVDVGKDTNDAETSTNRKEGAALVDIERRHIEQVLNATHWRIEGPGGAAERLNLRPSSLRSRMQRLGLKRSGSPARRS